MTSAGFSRRSGMVAGFLCALSALLAYRLVHNLTFFGFDAFPCIVASRIESWADFWGTFREPLMDRWFPLGTFFRPVTNLSIAADFALWKLNANGFHATDALLFGVSGLCLFWLMRRIAPRARVAHWLGLCLYLVHPLQLHVFTALARRSEMLCTVFVSLCIGISVQPRPRFYAALSFLLTALAVGAKETGVIAVPICYVICYTQTRSLALALKAILPHLLAVIGLVALRIAMLGGLGGYRQIGEYSPFEVVGATLEFLVAPVTIDIVSLSAFCLLVGCAVFGVVMLNPRNRQTLTQESESFLLILVGATWIAACCVFLLQSKSHFYFWYAFVPLIGFCIGMGGIVERLVELWNSPHPLTKLLSRFGVIIITIGIVVLAIDSPLINQYPALEAGSQKQKKFLADLEQKLSTAPPGAKLTTLPLPKWPPFTGLQSDLNTIGLMSGYSVQAWIDLKYPEKNAQLILARKTRNKTYSVRPPTEESIYVTIPQTSENIEQ